jgi:hypothetical protein
MVNRLIHHGYDEAAFCPCLLLGARRKLQRTLNPHHCAESFNIFQWVCGDDVSETALRNHETARQMGKGVIPESPGGSDPDVCCRSPTAVVPRSASPPLVYRCWHIHERISCNAKHCSKVQNLVLQLRFYRISLLNISIKLVVRIQPVPVWTEARTTIYALVCLDSAMLNHSTPFWLFWPGGQSQVLTLVADYLFINVSGNWAARATELHTLYSNLLYNYNISTPQQDIIVHSSLN